MGYWENISKIQLRQTAKGIKEYGQPIEANQMPDVIHRMREIESELIDALMYIEWAIDGIQRMEDDKK